jgi:hypothetical protein
VTAVSPELAPRVRQGLAVALLIAGAASSDPGYGLQVATAAALVVALGEIGAGLARRVLAGEPAAARWCAATVFATAVATLLATALGHFGVLRRTPFLLAVAALAAVLGWLDWGRGRGARAAAAGAEPVDGVPHPVAGHGPAAEPDEAARGVAKAARFGFLTPLSRLLTIGALVLLAFVWLHEAARSFDVPPGRGGDDFSYHLSAIAVWNHYADLRMIKFSMGDWSTAFYPILPELVSWALLAPLGTNDALARWSSLPFALAAFLAVWSLARRLGLSARGAALAVAGYGAVRSLLPHAFTAGSDHTTAFFSLAALDAALALAQRPTRGRFAYLGVAVGALAACKYIGLYNALTVVVVAAVALVVHWRGGKGMPRPSPRALAVGVALLGVAALAVGGYTYLRNAVTAGNPFYPQGLTVLGWELPGAAEASLDARMEWDDARIDVVPFLTTRSDLFGSHFPWTLLPAALLAPLLALWRGPRWHALVLALPVASFLQFLYLMHDHREARYFLAGVALAAVAFAWIVDRLPEPWRAALTAVGGVVFLAGVARGLDRSGGTEVTAALLAVGAAWAGVRAARHPAVSALWQRGRGWLPLAMAALLAVAALVAMPEYRLERRRAVRAAEVLEEMLGSAGGRVAYNGYNAPYPFFGSDLQIDVRLVPREPPLAAEYYTWGGTAHLPYWGSYPGWRRSLEELGIRHLVVVDGPDAQPELGWMRDNAGFEQVYDDGGYQLWRLRPEAASGRWRELREDDERPRRRREGGRRRRTGQAPRQPRAGAGAQPPGGG